MGSASRSALVVATSIGAIEALKDQGFCRWNFVLRSIQQHIEKTNLRSFSQANRICAQSSSYSSWVFAFSKLRQNIDESLRQYSSEDSLKSVMYLSCWGSSN